MDRGYTSHYMYLHFVGYLIHMESSSYETKCIRKRVHLPFQKCTMCQNTLSIAQETATKTVLKCQQIWTVTVMYNLPGTCLSKTWNLVIKFTYSKITIQDLSSDVCYMKNGQVGKKLLHLGENIKTCECTEISLECLWMRENAFSARFLNVD